MKQNTANNKKTTYPPDFSKMSEASKQRMAEKFHRNLVSCLQMHGLKEDEMELFFSAGSDPVQMAIAITTIQIAKEGRAANEAFAKMAFEEDETVF